MRKLKRIIICMVLGMMITTVGYMSEALVFAETQTENPGDIIENPWPEHFTEDSHTVEDLTFEDDIKTTGDMSEKIKVARVKINKITTKKMSAKKLKIQIKKIKGAKGYQFKVYRTKKAAKKNKKAIYKKVFKKNIKKFIIQSKKLKNKKNLYVRARAYKLNKDKKKVYGAWSKIRKVNIKK